MDNATCSIPLRPASEAPASSVPERRFPNSAFPSPQKILFLGGYGSRPGDVLPCVLRTHGHSVVEPDLPDNNFAQSVAIAQRVFNRHQPGVVVGWSRGGAVAMSIDSRDVPLILIAPAWRRWGTVSTVKSEAVLLHSPRDELIPVEDSRMLLRNSGLPQERLFAVGEDHRMIDEAAFVTLLEVVDSVDNPSQHRKAA